MSTMEEDTEFRDLIIKKLENNGVLMKMKAALRAQIYNLLEKENNSTNDDSQTGSITNNDSSLEPCDNTTTVALSLIQDLLDCLKLDVTKSIFKAESGEQQAKCALQTRTELMETLHLSDGCDDSDPTVSMNGSKVPVLVQYLAKNGVLSKLNEVNETFGVAASTSNSTTE